MKLYPAIDILKGNAVRLVKGDFAAKTVYDEDPLAAARSWTDDGARFLHVVDLDGAKRGEPVNVLRMSLIADETGLPVQYGGGLRSSDAVDAALAAGAWRVIIGTAVFTAPEVQLPYINEAQSAQPLKVTALTTDAASSACVCTAERTSSPPRL